MLLPPKYVKKILSRLEDGGFEARLVGGCVRDTLLSRRPGDWDAATSAPPEAVLRLFPRSVPTGIRHGTVTVLYGGGVCEVTTYRLDGAYSDRRRPDSVSFTPSLEADLARRDFTINAMAMDLAGRVTDPFGGRADLERGLIRCVGSPERRFSEDALRMFRALRFAARLGFEIDPGALAAIYSLAPLAESLSAERVARELRGILASPRPDMAWAAVDAGLLGSRLAEGSGPRPRLAGLPVYARLAGFCAALEQGGYIMSTEAFLRSLKSDARSLRICSGAAEIIRSGRSDYKRLLRDYGKEAVLAAYPKSREPPALLRSGEGWSRDALAVGGGELRDLGYSGREIGSVLDALVEHVIERPEDNRRDILCKLISEGKIHDRT